MFISEEWVTIFSLHDDKTTPHFWDHIICLALLVKNQSANAEDIRYVGSIPGSGISYKNFFLSMLQKVNTDITVL